MNGNISAAHLPLPPVSNSGRGHDQEEAEDMETLSDLHPFRILADHVARFFAYHVDG
ncbi:hypothetical protein SAMN05216403_101264 [Nitrosospira multiformis ATCC 25196]|uniref:Uncharacterized protein n=1 Tax=Nitrosospira multiformis (strain ATCC 25196 / NCIMB 11849 / C 71) TaxID=323848 RepID=A0A1H5RXD6_NITMU|nr:hypothetical protein SAMN05216403_101264 [Nitrosospira multiformis ATCC 25196]